MPTYEYRCRGCGEKFEVFHNMTDSSPRRCPECGGEAERMIGTGSCVIFKGPGFYVNDYAESCPARDTGECPSGKCGCEDSL